MEPLLAFFGFTHLAVAVLLAGDIYNESNQLIGYLTGEGGAYADSEAARLLG